MTCIVGIADGEKVWMGADSAGTAGYDQVIRADAKVFVNGPMVFGFTSSFRMGQLLRYKLDIPRPYLDDDVMSYLCGEWIDAVRTTLKEGGFARDKNPEEGGCFLMGFQGHLYQIDSDYQVGDPVDQFASVGCGEGYALGSLHSTARLKLPIKRRITVALEAAAYFSAGVAAPFVFASGGKARA